MPQINRTQQASELMWPVLHNFYWIKNALESYEAISNHAEELNTHHGHFFGFTQRFALESAIIGICKIYDEDDRSYSVLNLFKFLNKNFDADHLMHLRCDELCALNIPANDAGRHVAAFQRDGFDVAKRSLCSIMRSKIPTKENNDVLRKLFIYRNKFAAHQDQVSPEVKREFENLPSLGHMEELNNFAQSVCRLITRVFNVGTIVDPVSSGYTATCNVIIKTLGKTFDDPNKTDGENYEERERFYSHNRLAS